MYVVRNKMTGEYFGPGSKSAHRKDWKPRLEEARVFTKKGYASRSIRQHKAEDTAEIVEVTITFTYKSPFMTP